MPNYKLVIAYDGTAYRGWQYQPDQPTVQGTLTQAIQIITKRKPKLYAAGRTDAGVHALGQVANFRTNLNIPPESMKKALNSLLPPDIRIMDCEIVPDSFNARYSAKTKLYEYRIYTGEVVPPFIHRYVLHFPYPIDINAMKEACKYFVGQKDFSAFTTEDSPKLMVREILLSELERKGEFIYYRIKGRGFLKYMVRIIVGTLLEVGKGKLQPEDIEKIFESKDPKNAGPTAPPHGLFLVKVEY